MKFSTNEVTLIGFVGADAHPKQTSNNKCYTIVNLATNESWKDRNSGEFQKRVTWHLCVAWGRVSEAMVDLTKGSFVQIRGSIRNYEVPGKDGQPTRYFSEILVASFTRLDRVRRDDAVSEREAA